MMNLLNLKTELSSHSNTKCAEVFLRTVDSFSIVCTFCELKNFEFGDFLLHFKNVHLDKIYDNIKAESAVNQNAQTDTFQYNTEHLDSVEIKRDVSSLGNICAIAKNNSDNFLTPDVNTEDSSGEEFISMAQIHSTELNAKKYQCSECDKSYKLPKSLDYHKKRWHNADKMLKCSQCASEFSCESSLQKHVRRDHSRLPCDHCDKTYGSLRGLNYHKSKHSGELNFICNVDNCGKAFFHIKRLNAHKKFAHTKERKYVCEMCGFGLKSKQALDIHSRSHTGEKPYACQVCDRRFASSSQLSEHKPMHSTERPHVCGECGSAFARPKALYHHKHLHLNVKKFVCKVCGKAYAQAAGLCGHMRQHKAEQY